MNNRPKNTDTMEDILKMQSEFKKKEMEENLKPSAELKKCYSSGRRLMYTTSYFIYIYLSCRTKIVRVR